MAIKMLVFDVRDCEREFFESEKFENFEIKLYSNCLNEESVKKIPQEELDSAMVISVFLDSNLTEDVINSFRNLRIISTRSSSIEHINKHVTTLKNIDVVNVENYSFKTSAQFTIGLMIALVRNFKPLSQFVEKGETIDFTGYDISKLTLGVIGTGATGAEVCRIAEAIGMKVLAYDIVEKQELKTQTGTQYTDLQTLLKVSDVVTIHLPYSMESKNLITKRELDMMKCSAYLINIARSGIVNLKDLRDALKNKKIQGAGLDIRTCDSVNPNCRKFASKVNLECYEETNIIKELAKMPNVIITPHVAYKTADVLEYILHTSIRGVLDCIKGGSSFKAC
ncbi:hypothetical protein J6P92_08205 [bacterium]|nr:hypothetical protein [bacterium]